MTAHIAPHRWAEAWAGKLDDDEIATMDRHAERCPRCARARDRITRTSSVTFAAIRTQSPPEIAWDAVRARVHWSVSTERRARVRTHGRSVGILAWGAFAVGGVALGLATGEIPAPRPRLALAPVVASGEPKVAPAPIARVTGLVSKLSGDVMIDGVRRDDAFERALGSGTLLATGDGRVDVQFGDTSAFELGPRSTLELRKFDSETIALVVDGTIDVEVAPRAHGQRFLVIAGDDTIEVRGTQFRVVHDATGTKVACRHGLVAVRGRSGELEVAAARKLDTRSQHTVAMTADELAQLAQATPATLPLWNDTLAGSSAPLEIATVGKREVRVDGVELGAAPLRVRVMPGRHTVEAADSAGRFRRIGWVDVGAAHPARLEVPAEAVPTGGVAERKKQLHAGIDHARLARCTRAIAKAGVTNTYVQIEIAVDASGAVSFLNVLDTDLPAPTASCVHDALVDVRFRAGTAATWREKLDL